MKSSVKTEENEKKVSDILPTLIYSALTEEHLVKIKQFREDPQVSEYIYPPSEDYFLHTDFYLTRYLVAREWDHNKAKEMFIKAMKWRKANDVDNIIEVMPKNQYFEFLRRYWPGSIHEDWEFWTYDESFVSYQRIGSLDISLASYVPRADIIKYHIYCMELIERKYAKVVLKNGSYPGCLMVEDLSGLGMHFVDKKILDILQEAVQLDADYYPAVLRKFYLINTPKVFSMIWGVVKGFFDKATLDKFEVLGDTKRVVPQLKQIIPLKDLLKYLDGESEFEIAPGGSVKALVKEMGFKKLK
eukprot:TRINITY_DN10052_c0_g1_i1.p1 TRINITY_DN10052_c0_g1~~TRINITY_DN10052_c0_g1_i1.p1  ORF type:complete len:301 (+),score=82.45 TRINITY_DN10052_c0_g1_i1:126-1028(+)